MPLDPPAHIAILGAGPAGVEAALYARFLGYRVDVYERGRVADNLLRLGEQPLDVPWKAVPSPLGRAALEAQNPNWQAPNDDAVLSSAQAVERYYLPLSQSDLLADCIRTATTVLSVRREAPTREQGSKDADKDDDKRDEERTDPPFQILLRSSSGDEWTASADAVIDCTGLRDALEDGRPVVEFTLAGHEHFYILGQKTYPAATEIGFAETRAQIRDCFKVIGGRETLDLYATVRPLQ